MRPKQVIAHTQVFANESQKKSLCDGLWTSISIRATTGFSLELFGATQSKPYVSRDRSPCDTATRADTSPQGSMVSYARRLLLSWR